MRGASVNRSRELMNKNRIQGEADQGELAVTAKLLWSKGGSVNLAVVR